MLNLFGKKSTPAQPTIRDTLFGDMPLADWPSAKSPSANQEPWSSFVRARDVLDKKKKDEAIQIWRQITEMPDLEPRHYLQAWTFLHEQGIQPPPEKAKTVYGVVVEVAMKNGLDLLAAYPDGSARYYNYSGSGVVWEHPDSSLDPEVNALLNAARQLVTLIGPWEKPRPSAPTGDQVRLSILTPSGLHFGHGPFNALAVDPKGKPMIDAATALMLRLTNLVKR